MIDFINFELSGSVDAIKGWFLDQRIQEVVLKTNKPVGNFSYAKVGEDLLVKYYHPTNRVYVKGSLHKLNGYNWTNFSFSMLEATLYRLELVFGSDFLNSKIHNIEYGVNIKPPGTSKDIINGLMFYKGKPFKDIKPFSYGRYKRLDMQRIAIKCYDKKAQHRYLKGELLRFEIHVRKMAHFDDINVPLKTISDLLDKSILRSLGEDLVSKWNKIQFLDLDFLKSEEFDSNQNLPLWSNPNYWRELKRVNGTSNRKKISVERSMFRSFQEANGFNSQNHIKELIKTKWDDLLLRPNWSWSEITNLE